MEKLIARLQLEGKHTEQKNAKRERKKNNANGKGGKYSGRAHKYGGSGKR